MDRIHKKIEGYYRKERGRWLGWLIVLVGAAGIISGLDGSYRRIEDGSQFVTGLILVLIGGFYIEECVIIRDFRRYIEEMGSG